MVKVLIVDNEFEKYRDHLEPLFPDVEFAYAEDGDAAGKHVPETEVIVSIGRWLTPERLSMRRSCRAWMATSSTISRR